MRLIAILLFFFSFLEAGEIILELRGDPYQGSLLSGTIKPENAQVWFRNTEVTVIDGSFFLGIPADADSVQILKLITGSAIEEEVVFIINKSSYPVEMIDNIPTLYTAGPGDPLLTRRIQTERAVYRHFLESRVFSKKNFSLEFDIPVQGGRISSPFGIRRIINDIEQASHTGLDIAIPRGTPVMACADGVVLATDEYFYQGNFVMLEHGQGLKSVYLHLDSIIVKPCELVKKGDLIGTVGSTGRSSGPHLHWGVYWFEEEISPESLLKSPEPFYLFRKKYR